VGRPTKRTPQVEADLVQALRAGNTRQAACRFAGITQRTFERWLRFDGFVALIEKAESDAEVRMVAHVLKAATDGTWQAAAWWLERRRPEAYGRRFLDGLADGAGNPAAMQVTVLFDRPDTDTLSLPDAS
jgi:hypothetical protein